MPVNSDMDTAIRAMWPGKHVQGLCKALGVPRYRAKEYVCGYASMPPDLALRLADLFEAWASGLSSGLRDYAARRASALASYRPQDSLTQGIRDLRSPPASVSGKVKL